VTYGKEYQHAKNLIMRARGMVQDAMALGYIPMPEGSQPPRPSKAAARAVAKATAKKAPATPKAKATPKAAVKKGKKLTAGTAHK
jgi:hypothetical protein